MAIDIGRIAYEAYCLGINKQITDKNLLKWENMGKTIQDAWRSAACAVLDYIDDEKRKLRDEYLID